jgi:two-component system KDP operon response regulator KdpE
MSKGTKSETRPRILVIDDERQIRRFLRIALEAQGYEVLEAATGREGLALAATRTPELVILDLGLPDLDGHAVLAELRGWSPVPVIVLSVRAAEGEKVRALDDGANDYVTKPFGIEELTARIRVVLRGAQPTTTKPFIDDGHLRIDLARRLVTLQGRTVVLSRKEYNLLALLAQAPNRVLTQGLLLEKLWGPGHIRDTHYLRILVGKLRQKLGDDAAMPRYLLTEPGVGYRLRLPE